jgi:hypothetical protein
LPECLLNIRKFRRQNIAFIKRIIRPEISLS